EGALGDASLADGEEVAGRQELDVLEAGDGPGQREEAEQVVDAAQVGPGRHQPGGEQAAYLGREEQPIGLARPVQRADAGAIGPQEQLLSAAVPQGDGELAAQVLEDGLAVLLVEVRNDLGVAVGAEDVAAGLQGGALLGVVEEFAVEDDDDVAGLVGDG